MSLSVFTSDHTTTYQFYPITFGCNQLSLRVKASQDAHVILTNRSHEGLPCYEIFFGCYNNSKTILRKNAREPNLIEASSPGILNPYEHKCLWVRWEMGRISAGVGYEPTPTVSYHDTQSFSVSYFGIRTGRGLTGEWLIDQQTSASSQPAYPYPGPQPSTNPFHPIPSYFPPTPSCCPPAPSYCPPAPSYYPPAPSCFPPEPSYCPPAPSPASMRWVACAGGSLPRGAVAGGHDVNGEKLYVARASHAGAMLPGKFARSHKVAYVAWGGKEISKHHYEILCDCNPQWMSNGRGGLPRGALICGNTENGESLYVGRAHHEGSLVLGKVQRSHGVCYIPFGGAEIAKSRYEILILPSQDEDLLDIALKGIGSLLKLR